MKTTSRRLFTLLILLLIETEALWNSPFFSQAPPPTPTSPGRLRIAKTQRDDLPKVADMLSKAVNRRRRGINAYMDQLFAKQDILTLLEGRLDALRRGQAYAQRLSADFPRATDLDRHKLLWFHDAFRRSVDLAAQQTGETTFFANHNMAIPPPPQYLQHLQVTAYDGNQIVGFCEVGMLSNNNGTFVPSITNLCTDPDNRRRGVATRLLDTCERYVAQHWQDAKYMGLFVEKNNVAAIGLYQKKGYLVESEAPGGRLLGPMFHMRKDLKALTGRSELSQTLSTSEKMIENLR